MSTKTIKPTDSTISDIVKELEIATLKVEGYKKLIADAAELKRRLLLKFRRRQVKSSMILLIIWIHRFYLCPNSVGLPKINMPQHVMIYSQ